MQLSLDGIVQLELVLGGHLYRQTVKKDKQEHPETYLVERSKTNTSPWRAEVWGRLVLPVQACAILISTVVHQVLRGIGSVLCGAIQRDVKLIIKGGWEFVAVAAQIIAIPLIMLFSEIHLYIGQNVALMALEHHQNFQSGLAETTNPGVTFITGIFSGISLSVQELMRIPISLGNFEWKEVPLSLLAMLASLVSPLVGCLGLCGVEMHFGRHFDSNHYIRQTN